MAMIDPHSFADDAQPSTKHLDLALTVDFDARVLRGQVTLVLDRAADGTLDLDTRGLAIQRAVDASGAAVPFDLAANDPIRGSRLRLHTKGDRVTITYTTSPDATALQWLEPAQTKGGRHPYVFTQCQAIHARTIVPCQDSPRVRSKYTAKLDIPASLRAVMAAAHVGREEKGARAIESFEMPQAIPSYLFAFAVGNIASKDLGPRSRVYAEPETLDASAWEFATVDDMLVKAESLFGPYVWDRFDLLVMPPSFPYGGMENPRLTFLTPTLLAGDRSLVNVVAHELAHSWTGNLVTNATMNDFWLNEGFTVYAERRIHQALEGDESVALHAALGKKHLEIDLARVAAVDPRFTRLRTDLSGMHPDDIYSSVPYEKGYLFLRRIDELAGRERFDAFLKKYIATFQFRSITTDDFLGFFRAELPDVAERVGLAEWIDGAGLPETAPTVKSTRLDHVMAMVDGWSKGERPSSDALAKLDATEWQVFLSSLPKQQSEDDCKTLARAVEGKLQNAEIRVAWLTIAAASGHTPAYGAIEDTLLAWGRMKYLRPLYTALAGRGGDALALAKKVFGVARPGYHPVAQGIVDGILAKA
ncbi:M1 family metallopeptidase [Myxococcota bacterium]|nr:M1 family metallopeptidase [Myxococcota bacterium]